MAILDDLKSIAKTLREADKIPQYEQILDVREKMLEMQEENSNLKKENKKLKDNSQIENDLEIKNNCDYRKSNKLGPYCTCCWDDENKLLNLHKKSSGKIHCPKCKTVVEFGKTFTISNSTNRSIFNKGR